MRERIKEPKNVATPLATTKTEKSISGFSFITKELANWMVFERTPYSIYPFGPNLSTMDSIAFTVTLKITPSYSNVLSKNLFSVSILLIVDLLDCL